MRYQFEMSGVNGREALGLGIVDALVEKNARIRKGDYKVTVERIDNVCGPDGATFLVDCPEDLTLDVFAFVARISNGGLYDAPAVTLRISNKLMARYYKARSEHDEQEVEPCEE